MREVGSEAAELACGMLFWLLKGDDTGGSLQVTQMSCSQLHCQGFFFQKDLATSSRRDWKPPDTL